MKNMPEVMKEQKQKSRIKILVLILFILVIILIAILVVKENNILHKLGFMNDDIESVNKTTEITEKEETTLSEILMQAEQISTVEAMETVPQTEYLEETEAYATSHKGLQTEMIEETPLSTEIVELSDVYAEAGCNVQFKCYHPEAESYIWETYDIIKKEWTIREDALWQKDELYRQVSVCSVTANNEQDDMMIKCTINLTNGEILSQIASLFTIPHITQISVKEDCTFNAGSYIFSRNIPIKVTYENGKTDTLTGIYGISFVDTMESKELTTNEIGNVVETVTTVNTECEYSYIGVEEREVLLRYRNNDTVCDAKLLVSGKDLVAPEISTVEVSNLEVSNIDEPVNVNISIIAEDNETPYPYLEYAFLPQGTKPKEKDWTKKMSFEQKITQNGIWKAYCRDASGNIAVFEKEIIAVDQKAPVIKVNLEHTEWCISNKIIVKTEDELSVLYQFTCPETGEDSGWIARNEYDIKQNSTWKIQVKDAAGNIASETITVDNIDNQMPVINEITEGDHNEEI